MNVLKATIDLKVLLTGTRSCTNVEPWHDRNKTYFLKAKMDLSVVFVMPHSVCYKWFAHFADSLIFVATDLSHLQSVTFI